MVGNINNFSEYSPFSSDLKVLYEIKTNFSNKEKVRFSNYFLLLSWAISTILISSHRNITTLRSCQTWRSFLCFQRMYSEGSKSSGEKIEKEKNVFPMLAFLCWLLTALAVRWETEIGPAANVITYKMLNHHEPPPHLTSPHSQVWTGANSCRFD